MGKYTQDELDAEFDKAAASQGYNGFTPDALCATILDLRAELAAVKASHQQADHELLKVLDDRHDIDEANESTIMRLQANQRTPRDDENKRLADAVREAAENAPEDEEIFWAWGPERERVLENERLRVAFEEREGIFGAWDQRSAALRAAIKGAAE